MLGNRKVAMCLALGLPFLVAGYRLILSAIEMGRDLTATGVAVGALSAGVIGILGVFVYGNVQEHRAK